MRLSTEPRREVGYAVAVIHAALDAGVALLDTADVYAPDERSIGHNERCVAEALRTWSGDRSRVRVVTKGGLRRTGGRWQPDGRAKHLRAACEASRRALGVDVIDLYQLHAPDPRIPLETSVRALAALRDAGHIRAVGLCNVNVAQIEAARVITEIDAVQVELSPWVDAALRGGVAEYCRDHGITLIVYRPLGGARAARLERMPALVEIAGKHGATVQEVVLAWLCDLDPCVVPIPGATRIETARSLRTAEELILDAADHAVLDAHFPAGRLLRVPRAQRRPRAGGTGEVVLVMGMPAAGKSAVAEALEATGHERLNRDERGGRVSDLVTLLDAGLAAGRRHWVLDNTYPTRAVRNEVIECAWRHGVPVGCVHLITEVPDAQVNAITRMIEVLGHLPTPGELRERGRTDPRFFGPDAQFRWLRQVEPPVPEEGFASIEERTFARAPRSGGTRPAVFIEFDGGLCVSARGDGVALHADDVVVVADQREFVERQVAEGRRVIGLAWRPQVEQGTVDVATAQAAFDRVRDLHAGVIDILWCPHVAGPPVCWCRRPLPGLVIAAALSDGLDPSRSLMIGRPPADRTLAERLGMAFRDVSEMFGPQPPPT